MEAGRSWGLQTRESGQSVSSRFMKYTVSKIKVEINRRRNPIEISDVGSMKAFALTDHQGNQGC